MPPQYRQESFFVVLVVEPVERCLACEADSAGTPSTVPRFPQGDYLDALLEF